MYLNSSVICHFYYTVGYMSEGFLSLQRAIDIAIIQSLNPTRNISAVNVNVQRFPYPPYNDDLFVLVLQQQFPVILLLSFVFSALHIVKDIVMEKEKRIKVLNCFSFYALINTHTVVLTCLSELNTCIMIFFYQETLKMMGIGSWLQWLAWFVKYFIFLLIAVAIMTLFFSLKVRKGLDTKLNLAQHGQFKIA